MDTVDGTAGALAGGTAEGDWIDAGEGAGAMGRDGINIQTSTPVRTMIGRTTVMNTTGPDDCGLILPGLALGAEFLEFTHAVSDLRQSAGKRFFQCVHHDARTPGASWQWTVDWP